MHACRRLRTPACVCARLCAPTSACTRLCVSVCACARPCAQERGAKLSNKLFVCPQSRAVEDGTQATVSSGGMTPPAADGTQVVVSGAGDDAALLLRIFFLFLRSNFHRFLNPPVWPKIMVLAHSRDHGWIRTEILRCFD